MAANEVPEKIYITPNIDRKWQTEAIDDESIEYTRTDQIRKAVEIAREEIIKKGIEFLKDHLEGYDIFGSDIERSVESFKLAMEYE